VVPGPLAKPGNAEVMGAGQGCGYETGEQDGPIPRLSPCCGSPQGPPAASLHR